MLKKLNTGKLKMFIKTKRFRLCSHGFYKHF